MDQLLISSLSLLILSGCQTFTVTNPTDNSGTSSISAMVDPTASTETSFNGNPTYVGCFDRFYYFYHEDLYSGIIYLDTMGQCFRWCVRLGMGFAAIYNRLCFCSFNVTLETDRYEDGECLYHCDDMPGFTCGGPSSYSLYNITHLLPLAQNGSVDPETDVSFLIGRQASIHLYNSSNLFNPKFLFKTPLEFEDFSAADYHYQKNLMFVATESALYKTTLFQNNTLESYDIGIGRCQSFAVDWVQDIIIWVSCSPDDSRPTSCTLKFIDFEGNITSTISADLNTTCIRKVAVDPYEGMIFWINVDHVIDACETNGGNLRRNIGKPGVKATQFTLDISNKRLFYFRLLNTASVMYSVDYNGGDLKTHLEVPSRVIVYGLGISKGFVYWVDYKMLYKAPLYRGPAAQMMAMKLPKLYYYTSIVQYFKIVDPDLQRAPETGLCSSNSNSSLDGNVTREMKRASTVLLLVVVGVAVAVLLARL